MKGKQFVVVHDNNVKYELELDRKVSVIKGKSGTGKSTLYKMIESLKLNKRDVGIHSNMRERIGVLTDNWAYELENNHDMIFFTDEYFEDVKTIGFAEAVDKSDNYLVVISRSGRLGNLTYSVKSIYELVTMVKPDISIIRNVSMYNEEHSVIHPDLIICEDSNAGMTAIESAFNLEVKSAKGKDNVFNTASPHFATDKVCIIADGAAFGGVYGRFAPYLSSNIQIYAFESFEYLILCSGMFEKYVHDELEHTYDYCDSREFITWERFYTDLLIKKCSELYGISYTKSKLPFNFQSEKFLEYYRSMYSTIKDTDDSNSISSRLKDINKMLLK